VFALEPAPLLGAAASWQDVVLQAINVLQVVLLAVLSRSSLRHGAALDAIEEQSRRRRSQDPIPGD
jgi:hypothetical protein